MQQRLLTVPPPRTPPKVLNADPSSAVLAKLSTRGGGPPHYGSAMRRRDIRFSPTSSHGCSLLATGWTCRLLLLGLLGGCSDIKTEHYANYDEAIAGGAAQRGWLPPFVPPAATDIRLTHSLDSNQQWLRFRMPSAAMEMMRRDLSPLSRDEALSRAEADPRKRKEWRRDVWNGNEPLAFYSWCSGGECMCVAIRSTADEVFGWSCRHP